MNSKRTARWPAAVIAALIAGTTIAADPPSPRPLAYEEAPVAIRDYLLKAKQADTIADPLQRCLAYPDPPGNRWPAGLIKAHCEYTFSPRISLADIRSDLARGAVAELEKKFSLLLERHFSETDFSEDLHAAFLLFDASYEAGRASKDWLEAAPDSAYAMTARAEYFRQMGWTARGGKYAAETPAAYMARMGEFHDKAIDLYLGALKLEPRMLQAYSGLVDIDKNSSSNNSGAKMYAASQKLGRGCKELASVRMMALRPRWGGSYPEMLQLNRELETQLPQRPLLALSMVWPYLDAGDVLYDAEKYQEAMAAISPALEVSSSPQGYEDMGMAMAAANDKDEWLELSYLVAASRFRPGTAAAGRQRGRLQLLLARDPAWANASLVQAAKQEPESAYGRYLLAASYLNGGRFLEAEPDYLLAMNDPKYRRDSLIELSRSMIAGKASDKARKYVDLLNKEYPGYAPGWMLRAQAYSGSSLEVMREALEKFVATADETDPKMAEQVVFAQAALKQMKAQVLKAGGKW